MLGGLPVWADVQFGKDPDTPNGPGEFWAEVLCLRWVRRDGSPGRELPPAVVDRAEAYDYGFCDLTQAVSEELAFEAHERGMMEWAAWRMSQEWAGSLAWRRGDNIFRKWRLPT